MGDWLVRQFALLGGVPIQNWMLLALAILVVWVVFTWLTRSRDSFYFFLSLLWLVIVIGWLLFLTFAE